MTLDELIDRLGKATGPDVSLDYAIQSSADNDNGRGALIAPLPYTASLDAIVALVERVAPGMDWDIGHHTIERPHYQGIMYPFAGGFTNTEEGGGALMADHFASPALALCLAFARMIRLVRNTAQEAARKPGPRLRIVAST